jgi:hypothetical protein
VQIGTGLINANPRTLLNAGRWFALALAVMTPLVLLWLVINGRSTLAMMLAAFVLPAFIEGARRWRGAFPSLSAIKNLRLAMTSDPREGDAAASRFANPAPVDPELAEQCAALLRAYPEQVRPRVEHQSSNAALSRRGVRCSANGTGRTQMPIEEALEVFGLEPSASSTEICEAHRRLEERLDSENGGTRYLWTKINETRDVLLDV